MDNNFMGDPFGSVPASTNTLPDAFGTGGSQTPPPSSHKKRGLHWIQTLVVLIVTTGVSFLLAMLLDVRFSANPFLEPTLVLKNGLFFGLLAAAILITAFLIEFSTSAMTPRFSRKLQLAVVLVATLLCGGIGALGELFFVNNYVLPQIAPTPTIAPTATPTPEPPTPEPTATPEPGPAYSAIILALDQSGSMYGIPDRITPATQAIADILPMIPEDIQVGFILFTNETKTVPIAPNTAQQRRRIIEQSNFYMTSGGTDFPLLVEEALEMFRASGVQGRKKFIIVTDGDGGSVDSYVSAYTALDIEVSAVMIQGVYGDLRQLVTQTGGSFTTVNDLNDLIPTMVDVVIVTATPSPSPAPTYSPVPTPSPTIPPEIGNMIYELDDSAYYLLLILVLEGLVLGVALTLMLSLSHQFRIQLILSPLMGICAFFVLRYIQFQVRQDMLSPVMTGAAYALFGVVLMRRNDGYGDYPGRMPTNRAQTSGLDIESIPQSNNNGSFGDDPFGGNGSLF